MTAELGGLQSWAVLTTDVPLIMYLIGVVINLYGFLLFLWWWHRAHNASEVYVYVMLLFAAHCWSDAANLLARLALHSGAEFHHQFVNSAFWNVRRLPEIAVVAAVLYRMTRRVLLNKQGMVVDRRSGDDRRQGLPKN